MELRKIGGVDNPADAMTKPMGKADLGRLLAKVGVHLKEAEVPGLSLRSF